jgi:hypothetical protein
MAQYIINFTDDSKTSFNVSPYTTNGPTSPTVLALDPSAVSANTSLLLYGQGMPNYGERIQENILHLLENFSGPNVPTYAIEGQLWYNTAPGGSPVASVLNIYNGSAWDGVILASGTTTMTANLGMGGNQINNLADPTELQDAVTVAYADATYLNVAADGMTGNLNMNSNLITNVGDPVSDADAMSRLYADNRYVNVTGDTMSGVLYMGLGGSPADTNQIKNVADPTTGQDAATKQYVDDQLLSLGADGVVNNGSLSWPNITLTRTLGLPDVTIDISHTHAAADTTFTATGDIAATDVQAAIAELDTEKAPKASPNFSGTIALTAGATLILDSDPITALEAATKQYVDFQVGAITPPTPLAITIARDLTTSSGATLFTAPLYVVGSNNLMVHVNGIKYYASTAGRQKVEFAPSSMDPAALIPTGLGGSPASSYSFDITVDGVGPQIITIDGSLATTPDDLITQLNLAIAAGSPTLAVTASLYDADNIIFTSNSIGVSSSVLLSDIDLFSSLPGFYTVITDVLAGVAGAGYFGIPGDYSFHFVSGETFSISGSTGNDGAYTVHASGSTYVGGETRIYVTTTISDSTVDGTFVTTTGIIKPAVAGRSEGYTEVGTVDAFSTSISFTSTVPAGAVVEFLVFS